MNGIVLRDINIEQTYSCTVAAPITTLDLKVECAGRAARKVQEQVVKMTGAVGVRGTWPSMSSKLFGILANSELKIDRIIFNNQATILFWNDGEKTVVKCRECGDGHCIYDKDFELFVSADNTVVIDDVSQLDGAVENIARCAYCQQHFDHEKAVMAAMLKRLYPNFQDAMRKALKGGE